MEAQGAKKGKEMRLIVLRCRFFLLCRPFFCRSCCCLLLVVF